MTGHHSPAASGTDHVVVCASAADLDVLGQVIADSFFGLAPSRWLIPDPDARRQIFPRYFRLFAGHVMNSGIVCTTPSRTAVALWIPTGNEPAAMPGDYDARLAALTGPWLSRFEDFDTELGRHHLAGIAHHHLAILAVHPDRQRQGIGTALLRAHHASLDRDRIPAYLEASDLGTRSLYLRHCYTDYGPPIQLPGGPRMYPMIRQPHFPAQNSPGPGPVPEPTGGRPHTSTDDPR